MRVLAILLLLVFAIIGVIFGALNADMVAYDLVFAHVNLPKGAALIAALVLGWILGGVLVWLLSARPNQRRLRKSERALAASNPIESPP
ncbi:MAG: DUF1049 domain-containing protein [Xanthomonadales bacterium]|nr:DUF1049 domain-containing protein [Xanthomonadales bacterium]